MANEEISWNLQSEKDFCNEGCGWNGNLYEVQLKNGDITKVSMFADESADGNVNEYITFADDYYNDNFGIEDIVKWRKTRND